MNVELSLNILHNLIAQGVREFCLCPGGRNAPLVKALQLINDIRIYSFYDERAAAFFALGAIKRSARPVAVVTTSGTAVANLLPACVEAHYTYKPLLLLTADRPKSHRNSGSPQTIEQVGIFSHYVEKTYDISELSEVNITIHQQPVHVNVCFAEPLLNDLENVKSSDISANNDSFLVADTSKGLAANTINDFISRSQRPLVVVGPLDFYHQEVKTFLKKWPGPIYTEATSGLREDADLQPRLLKGGEGIFYSQKFLNSFDGLIRIGQVPTLRLWRDLEDKLTHWPVLNFSLQKYSGLSRDSVRTCPLQDLQKISIENFESWGEDLIKNSEAKAERFKSLFYKYPRAESSLLHFLSEVIPVHAKIFLGNSLPIREWDFSAIYQAKNWQYACNRGANGIDGLVATALGWSDINQPTFCILGDLSAMYDMNALQILEAINNPFHLVVINNGGGKIFSPMFNDPAFENRHNKNFQPLAHMFNMKYNCSKENDFTNLDFTSSSLTEIIPDNEQSQLFQQEYKILMQKEF